MIVSHTRSSLKGLRWAGQKEAAYFQRSSLVSTEVFTVENFGEMSQPGETEIAVVSKPHGWGHITRDICMARILATECAIEKVFLITSENILKFARQIIAQAGLEGVIEPLAVLQDLTYDYSSGRSNPTKLIRHHLANELDMSLPALHALLTHGVTRAVLDKTFILAHWCKTAGIGSCLVTDLTSIDIDVPLVTTVFDSVINMAVGSADRIILLGSAEMSQAGYSKDKVLRLDMLVEEPSSPTPSRRDLLVSVGGTEHGASLLRAVHKALSVILRSGRLLKSTVVSGDILFSLALRLFSDMPNTRILKSTAQFQREIAQHSCVITQAGFQTLSECRAAGIPTVAVSAPFHPFQRRAVIDFQEYPSFACFDLETQTPLELADLVLHLVTNPAVGCAPISQRGRHMKLASYLQRWLTE